MQINHYRNMQSEQVSKCGSLALCLAATTVLQVHSCCYKYTVTAKKQCRILEWEWERGNSLYGKDSLSSAHLIQLSAQLT